jgi:N-acetylneuraminic acid mutarotase
LSSHLRFRDFLFAIRIFTIISFPYLSQAFSNHKTLKMKRLLVISVILLCSTFISLAQTPQKFNYQAVARDNTGAVIKNQNISLRISIRSGSTSGVNEYVETFSVTTNDFGLMNLEIGGGIPVLGNMANIDWGKTTYFIAIEMDASGGTNYTLMGTSQLLSVPYALYAEKAGSSDDGDTSSINEIQQLTLQTDTLFLSKANQVVLPFEDLKSSSEFILTDDITPSVKYNYSGNYLKTNEDGSWTLKSNLPTTRSRLKAETVGNKIYVIGGENGSTEYTTNEEYDPQSDTWTTMSSMSIARSSFGIATFNNRIYVIGGYGGYGIGVLDDNEVYNPALDSWDIKASMPAARGFSATATLNGKIYVIGGYNSNNNVVSTVEVYDPANNSWTTGPSISIARMSACAVTLNGKIYLMGGFPNPNGVNALNSVEIFDPATNTWSLGKSFYYPRGFVFSKVENNRIYLIGGSNGNDLSYVEEFDPLKNTWNIKTEMPLKNSASAVASNNGYIYVFGGHSNANKTMCYNSNIVKYYIHKRK